jgi:hypothetical protein
LTIHCSFARYDRFGQPRSPAGNLHSQPV